MLNKYEIINIYVLYCETVSCMFDAYKIHNTNGK